jgi:hypothetical protein
LVSIKVFVFELNWIIDELDYMDREIADVNFGSSIRYSAFGTA